MTKRRKKISPEETEARRQKFKELYKDLTDSQIADIHEVSIRTVQRWKKGEYDPGFHLKFALHDKMSRYGHFVGDHQRAVDRLRRILKNAHPEVAGTVAGLLKFFDDFEGMKKRLDRVEKIMAQEHAERRSGKERRHKKLKVVENRRNGTDRRS
jgi:DNA-binding XRE family transcriptional regulator